MRVVICIVTFKRRELLRKLLMGLSQLKFSKTPAPEMEVVVVDNDAHGTAGQICESANLPWPIKYAIEPRRGITYARNRAVCEAGSVDFVALIDDDEVPTPTWLDELLWTQAHFQADVVSGPVTPNFAADVAVWVRSGGFFDRPAFTTGRSLDKCSTNNVLIRRCVFDCVSGFDDDFKLSGGEDTHFFLRVRRAGFSIVWSQEAIVHEAISRERARLAWILQRSYQCGNSWSLCESSLDGRQRVRLVRLVKASAHIARGAALAIICLLFGRAAVVRSLRTVCLGAGMLTGLAGHKYLAYQVAGTDRPESAAELKRQISTT